jgi:hypothetical protein
MKIEQSDETDFKKRRIKLKDGRYMIFYTFKVEHVLSPEDAHATRPGPESNPQAEEEPPV